MAMVGMPSKVNTLWSYILSIVLRMVMFRGVVIGRNADVVGLEIYF